MRVLAFIGVLAILAAIGAAVFFFGGFFSVAENEKNPAAVDWAFETVRMASVARHATDAPPNSLDDPAAIQAGARAFASIGCVNCHGGPGVGWAKFSEGLIPVPADLKDMAKQRTPSELFWAIRNGIKFTGMPSFAGAGLSDPQIWSIVAFVRKLPAVTDADYKAWTAAP